MGESSLSEDEEEVGTCGRWAGLQEEAVAPEDNKEKEFISV